MSKTASMTVLEYFQEVNENAFSTQSLRELAKSFQETDENNPQNAHEIIESSLPADSVYKGFTVEQMDLRKAYGKEEPKQVLSDHSSTISNLNSAGSSELKKMSNRVPQRRWYLHTGNLEAVRDDSIFLSEYPVCMHSVVFEYYGHDGCKYKEEEDKIVTRSPLADDNTPEKIKKSMLEALEIKKAILAADNMGGGSIAIRGNSLLTDGYTFLSKLEEVNE